MDTMKVLPKAARAVPKAASRARRSIRGNVSFLRVKTMLIEAVRPSVDRLSTMPRDCFGLVCIFLGLEQVGRLNGVSRRTNALGTYALTIARDVKYKRLRDPVSCAKLLKKLRTSGANITSLSLDRSLHEMALSLALQIRYSQGVAALLRGCDPTTPIRMCDDLTPLLYATPSDIVNKRYHYLATSKKKRRAGGRAAKRAGALNGSYDNTVLHVATHTAQHKMVEIILRDDLIDVNRRNFFKNSPLHLAVIAPRWNRARRQSLAIIDSFLAKESVDFNARNCQNVTPVMIAAAKGRVSVVTRLLSDPRVDAVATDSQGRGIVHLAAENGHVELIALFLRDPRLERQLNARTKAGRTPLHQAAYFGRIGTMGALLRDERVDAHTRDAEGKSFMQLFLGYNEASTQIRKRIKTDNQSFDEDYVPSFERCQRIQVMLHELATLFATFEEEGTGAHQSVGGKWPNMSVGGDARGRIVDLYSKHWEPTKVKGTGAEDSRTELIVKYC